MDFLNWKSNPLPCLELQNLPVTFHCPCKAPPVWCTPALLPRLSFLSAPSPEVGAFIHPQVLSLFFFSPLLLRKSHDSYQDQPFHVTYSYVTIIILSPSRISSSCPQAPCLGMHHILTKPLVWLSSSPFVNELCENWNQSPLFILAI